MEGTKVAIVTGGNKGIGLAIVKALCKQFDGDVFLTSRNDDRGKEAVKLVESEGLKVKYHQLDIDDENSIKKLYDFIKDTYGGIDVLVNNAAIAFKNKDPTPFGEQAKVTLATNFYSNLNMYKTMIPIVRPNGRVVNISSFVSQMALKKCSLELQKEFRSDSITEEQLKNRMEEFVSLAQDGKHESHGFPNSAYGVSKIAVTVMTRIHARMLRDSGRNDVLLNAADPGWVRTDMAGQNALKSPEEGADTPVYLALLPPGTSTPHGELVSDRKIQEW